MSARTPAAYCCNERILNVPFGGLFYPSCSLSALGEPWNLLKETEDSWKEETRETDKGKTAVKSMDGKNSNGE